jgi:hypothetical protein
MPKKKKNTAPAAKAAPAKKVNKSAWIRSQPAAMPAKDVLAKATEAGIRLSLAQVYTARSSARKKAPHEPGSPTRAETANGTAARAKRARANAERGTDAGAELALRNLVFRVGLTRAQALLDEIKSSVGI